MIVTITTIDEVYKSGAVKLLFDRGLISAELMLYFKYYEDFVLFRNEGKTYREAILCVSVKYNKSESTIERAVRKLRT